MFKRKHATPKKEKAARGNAKNARMQETVARKDGCRSGVNWLVRYEWVWKTFSMLFQWFNWFKRTRQLPSEMMKKRVDDSNKIFSNRVLKRNQKNSSFYSVEVFSLFLNSFSWTGVYCLLLIVACKEARIVYACRLFPASQLTYCMDPPHHPFPQSILWKKKKCCFWF